MFPKTSAPAVPYVPEMIVGGSALHSTELANNSFSFETKVRAHNGSPYDSFN